MMNRWSLVACLVLAAACGSPPAPPPGDGGSMDAGREPDTGTPVADAGSDACTGTGCCATPDCGCAADRIPCFVDGAIECVNPLTNRWNCGGCGMTCGDGDCNNGDCCGTPGRLCCPPRNTCYGGMGCTAGLCT